MKILVAGGGIGGLAAAIALLQRGHTVRVFEQAPALAEVGAGLQISANGWRVLEALGVTEAIRDTLFEPEAIEMRIGRSGRQVFSLPVRAVSRSRWGAPYVHIHRADLQNALLDRLHALSPDALRVDARMVGYTQDDEQVSVDLADGSRHDADLLIGADGLHSTIRRQMLGPGNPRYTGNIAWRAVVPVEALGATAPPPTACIWVGDGRHAVTTRLQAGRLANFVGMVERPEPAEEGWRVEGTRAEAEADFAGWHPTIAALIAAAPRLLRWALFDRAPLPRWSEGGVTLLGDAAHPMLPSMAQGAVQALEDAWILADLLDRVRDRGAALEAYEQLRLPRTARIQRGSAANARLFHHAAPWKGPAVYGAMGIGARLFPNAMLARQDWVYGYDPLRAVQKSAKSD